MTKINNIIKYDLCLGCGLCEAIVPDKCKMKLHTEGFYRPHFVESLSKEEENFIADTCPGTNVIGQKLNSNIWGNVISIKEAWANDEKVRYKASSGGVITALAIYLLKMGLVDGVLHVGNKKGSYLSNELKLSFTAAEVLNNTGSRYAPALVFDKLKSVLDTTEGKYLFIGKPCDIAGLNNFTNNFPKYKGRIVLTISLFCAGMPSYNATNKLLSNSGYKEKPDSIKYRGDGWPGFFTAKYKENKEYKVSYNDSWGKVLGRHLGFRCKICPDGIGLLADISVGDSWETKDGYPDFEESEGRSFVMIRTEKGNKLFYDAVANKNIEMRDLNIENIKNIQKYQYKRRVLVGYRLIPIQLLSGFILNFKNIGINRMFFKAKIKSGIGEFLGALSRFYKIKYRKND